MPGGIWCRCMAALAVRNGGGSPGKAAGRAPGDAGPALVAYSIPGSRGDDGRGRDLNIGMVGADAVQVLRGRPKLLWFGPGASVGTQAEFGNCCHSRYKDGGGAGDVVTYSGCEGAWLGLDEEKKDVEYEIGEPPFAPIRNWEY